MYDPKKQVADVNHFDNKVVVKFEDGKIALLDGAEVRRSNEAQEAVLEDEDGALACPKPIALPING